MNPLRGATALVTGASYGIGPHIARALAKEGVRLALVARTRDKLDAVTAELGAVSLPADLLRRDAAAEVAARATQALGQVDILVNNAGMEPEGAYVALTPEEIADTIELNVTSPMLLTRALLPGMLGRGRGHVVNIASAAGKKAVPYDAVYGGTKAAIVEWTNALRVEIAKQGVGVSVICPTYVREEGMFARHGMKAPATIGSCTPAQVARAVVSAIQRNRPEVIVNSMPLRPLLALYALYPGIADWALDLLGVTAFQRRKAGSRV